MGERCEIWFNGRCSKCRGARELLEESGKSPIVTRYLEQTPPAERIREVLTLLGTNAYGLLRTSESLCDELGLSESSPEEEIIAAMVEHPILIQRPVVIMGDRAVIGRPVERVHELLDR